MGTTLISRRKQRPDTGEISLINSQTLHVLLSSTESASYGHEDSFWTYLTQIWVNDPDSPGHSQETPSAASGSCPLPMAIGTEKKIIYIK